MKIGEKIRKARKKTGLSQQDLSKQTGIHLTNLNRLEKGHSLPSIEALKKLVDALGVPADYLLDESDDLLEMKITKKSLAAKIKLVDSLDQRDKEFVEYLIDTMLTKKRVLEALDDKNLAVQE